MFTYLIYFIRFLVITNIHLIYYITLFLNIVYFFLRTQFLHFQDFFICIQCFFLFFTNLISFIRSLVINNIYLIYFIRLFVKCFLYFSGVLNFIFAYSSISFCIVIYKGMGVLKNEPINP